jgi:hypothetical protein
LACFLSLILINSQAKEAKVIPATRITPLSHKKRETALEE